MSTPITRSSGAITTTGVAISTGTGVLTFIMGSTDSIARCYSGTSSAGTFIGSAASSAHVNISNPVQYDGLWVVLETTAGTSVGSVGRPAVVHYA